jgi:hypothetical protein
MDYWTDMYSYIGGRSSEKSDCTTASTDIYGVEGVEKAEEMEGTEKAEKTDVTSAWGAGKEKDAFVETNGGMWGGAER